MHLCDDPDRDDGDLSKSSFFEKDCNDIRLETVSLKDDFSLIYAKGFEKTEKYSRMNPCGSRSDNK